MFCAPGIRKKLKGCFDRQALIRIIDSYNSKYPNNQIRYDKNLTDNELWGLIRNSFANVCGENEWCWLDQDFLKNDPLLQDYYKPPKPDQPTKWLSTSDINGVLKQFENIYDDFAFMGTVPIDFDQVIEEYSKMDLCALYNKQGLSMETGERLHNNRGIRRFGFVFNLDPSTKRGSHWVAMYMDLTVAHPYVGYFDSYGYCPPPEEITVLMERLKKQAHKCLGINLIKRCNTIRHQHKNTECGVYAIYFIYNCLIGKSFETVTENIILDDDVNKYRDFFFRPTIDSIKN